MPKKILELTVEIEIQSVTCPGVWLCPNGHISLTVFTLGTSYQTCCLPPVFPLHFRDLFYFRKRFQKICCINDMHLLLHDEMIYCELVQWVNKCDKVQAHVLAQYLGTLNELLFPPQMCSNEGIDLLMRPAKHFPGILSPKIEVATKLRIDEIWDNHPEGACDIPCLVPKGCYSMDALNKKYQKRVCHSVEYHTSPHCSAKVKTGCTSKCKIDSVTLQRDSVPRKTYVLDHKNPPYTAQVQTSPRRRCVQTNCYMQQHAVTNFPCDLCSENLTSKEVCSALHAYQPIDCDSVPYKPSIATSNNYESFTYCNQQPTITRLESNDEHFRDRDVNYPFCSTSKRPPTSQSQMGTPSNLIRINGEIALGLANCPCTGTKGIQKKQRPHKLRSQVIHGTQLVDCVPSGKLDCTGCNDMEYSNTLPPNWVRTTDELYSSNNTDNEYPRCDPCGNIEKNPIAYVVTPTITEDYDQPGQVSDRSIANDMCLDSRLHSGHSCLCHKYLSLTGNYSYKKLSTPVPYTCEICKKYEMLFNNNENIIKCCGPNIANIANMCCRQ